MGSILFWLGVLVVLSLLSPLLKLALAAFAGKEIGDAALANQPDTIHLEPRDESAWKKVAAVRRIVDTLHAQDFEDAGVHAVNEMPGLHVQLMAHVPGGFYAAVYEHPAAGVWADIVTLYPDGSSSTFTSAGPSGLSERPGHPIVNMPGAEVLEVLSRARRERPREAHEAASAERAVQVFEEAYADSMAYRRSVGVSREEVVNVAMEEAA